MQTVHLYTKDVDAVKWPSDCPNCGKDLDEDTAAEIAKYHGKKRADMGPIREHWKTKETSELLATWVENDRISWRPEAFDVIREILEDRAVAIPPQGDPKAFASSFVGLAVKRRLRSWLARRKPKTIAMRLCVQCARRAHRGRALANVAGVVMFFDLVMALILTRAYPSRSQTTINGAAAALWLGFLIMAVGESIWKRNTGMRIVRTSRFGWKFLFRNKTIASEFEQINREFGAGDGH